MVAKAVSAGKSIARIGDNLISGGRNALKTGTKKVDDLSKGAKRLSNKMDNAIKTGAQTTSTKVDDALKVGQEFAETRIKNASTSFKEAANSIGDSVKQAGKQIGDLNLTPDRETSLAGVGGMGAGVTVGEVVNDIKKGAQMTGNKLKDFLNDVAHLNISGSGKGGRIDDTLEEISTADNYRSPNSFKNQMNPILEKHGIDMETFQELKLKPVNELTNEEVAILKDIRDSVPKITTRTELQKTIPKEDIESYLSGDYTEIGGYVAKSDDVAHIKTYEDVVESSRLDYKSWDGKRPFPDGGTTYGKIEFTTSAIEDIEIPYGEKFDGINTDGPPCTLNGFTGARNGEVIPEWLFGDRHAPAKRCKAF